MFKYRLCIKQVMIKTKCANCKKTIYKYPSELKKHKLFFCNRKCKGKYKTKNRNKDICTYCGKEFNIHPANVKRAENNFCSKECVYKYRKGKSLQELVGKEKGILWINKLSKAKKGKTHTEIFGEKEALRRIKIIKEKVHPLQIGKTRPDMKYKWANARKPYNYDVDKKELQRLRKHGQYKTWREQVLKRDNYKCVKCGSTKNVQADHKIPIFEDRTLMLDLNNGQTLCSKCHKEKTSKEHRKWLKQG